MDTLTDILSNFFVSSSKKNKSNKKENSLANSLFLFSKFIIKSFEIKFYLVFLNLVQTVHLCIVQLYLLQHQIRVLRGIVC